MLARRIVQEGPTGEYHAQARSEPPVYQHTFEHMHSHAAMHHPACLPDVHAQALCGCAVPQCFHCLCLALTACGVHLAQLLHAVSAHAGTEPQTPKCRAAISNDLLQGNISAMA
jgi:hypothetical protein